MWTSACGRVHMKKSAYVEEECICGRVRYIKKSACGRVHVEECIWIINMALYPKLFSKLHAAVHSVPEKGKLLKYYQLSFVKTLRNFFYCKAFNPDSLSALTKIRAHGLKALQ